MEHEIVAVEGDTGVVRVEVCYGDPVKRLYRDLWIVRLDDARALLHFEEWPFWPDGHRARRLSSAPCPSSPSTSSATCTTCARSARP